MLGKNLQGRIFVITKLFEYEIGAVPRTVDYILNVLLNFLIKAFVKIRTQ